MKKPFKHKKVDINTSMPRPGCERIRELTQTEIDKLLSEMVKSNSPLLHAFKFSIKNPIRFGDLKRLRRENLKFHKDKPFIEIKCRKSPVKMIYIHIDGEMLSYWDKLPSDCEYLFPVVKKDGSFTQLSDNVLKYHFRKVICSAGISDFRWYDLRHMALINYVNNGVELIDLYHLGIFK